MALASIGLVLVHLVRELLNGMLKRRASKRFVLAESGEPVAWDTTTDNDKANSNVGAMNENEPITISIASSLSSCSSTSSVSNETAASSYAASLLPTPPNQNNVQQSVQGSRLTVPITTNTAGGLK